MKSLIVMILVGKAMMGDRLAYTERHESFLSSDGLYQSIQTTYTNEFNTPFGSLKSDFSRDKFIPDYEFENKLIGLKEKVVKSDDGKKLIVVITEKNKTQTYEMPVVDNAVMGQGFHNFILTHFEELNVKPFEVNFLIPRKKDFFRFKIKKEKETGQDIFLSLRPSNFFLKALVPKIIVSYDRKTKKLISFEGVTNIEQENGDTINARITFNRGDRDPSSSFPVK